MVTTKTVIKDSRVLDVENFLDVLPISPCEVQPVPNSLCSICIRINTPVAQRCQYSGLADKIGAETGPTLEPTPDGDKVKFKPLGEKVGFKPVDGKESKKYPLIEIVPPSKDRTGTVQMEIIDEETAIEFEIVTEKEPIEVEPIEVEPMEDDDEMPLQPTPVPTQLKFKPSIPTLAVPTPVPTPALKKRAKATPTPVPTPAPKKRAKAAAKRKTRRGKARSPVKIPVTPNAPTPAAVTPQPAPTAPGVKAAVPTPTPVQAPETVKQPVPTPSPKSIPVRRPAVYSKKNSSGTIPPPLPSPTPYKIDTSPSPTPVPAPKVEAKPKKGKK